MRLMPSLEAREFVVWLRRPYETSDDEIARAIDAFAAKAVAHERARVGYRGQCSLCKKWPGCDCIGGPYQPVTAAPEAG